ncbi:uncharacterized protein [Fopius arisanus]|uniref:Uncharacterized protein isoform X1 n=1 Tax=Fopius arisanus TaxID=64838 RepID=A0A9R1SUY7_9HYME|nr:PREDICTED: uncharacterized protein LOC105263244 isoform X1 [Fopius arisanus]XP_011297626.1 PREDICTED: uncharacterized protein LOC105263244 isoform X1 [Fopius arisanus]XP_011297627.1 PREDICTED: uncharacterized protein LOC105263244 isoform X1 [Fopius arisanus]XP_011297628.1 PREDICTED: uncharacterized protein LOC105263244 isoform X1 [Fopius arisanus]
MNTRDSIRERTKLPKTNDSSIIKVSLQRDLCVKKESTKNTIRTPKPIKNAHLVMYDDDPISPEERLAYHSNESSLDEAHISVNVLEAYGCEVPDNNSIEELFKAKIQKEKFSSEKSKFTGARGGQKCQRLAKEVFSKNVLMRTILGKQLESMNLGSSTHSTSGKDHDSDGKANSIEYVEMPDDPDVLLRPGMMGKGIVEDKPVDDVYRFAHRGAKQTITSRRYLMDNIDDDDFIFKKKQ